MALGCASPDIGKVYRAFSSRPIRWHVSHRSNRPGFTREYSSSFAIGGGRTQDEIKQHDRYAHISICILRVSNQCLHQVKLHAGLQRLLLDLLRPSQTRNPSTFSDNQLDTHSDVLLAKPTPKTTTTTRSHSAMMAITIDNWSVQRKRVESQLSNAASIFDFGAVGEELGPHLDDSFINKSLHSGSLFRCRHCIYLFCSSSYVYSFILCLLFSVWVSLRGGCGGDVLFVYKNNKSVFKMFLYYSSVSLVEAVYARCCSGANIGLTLGRGIL